jgi:hypothetical protein
MPASGVLLLIGVTDGARTRDLRGHIPALYRLSYDHQGLKSATTHDVTPLEFVRAYREDAPL